MATEAAEPVLIVSPRYADEVAASVTVTGMLPRIERRAERAAERFAAEPARLVVVDARGALVAGIAAARALGGLVEARQGAMLLLLSRVDAGATGIGHDAGATSVLVSPFGTAAFGNALLLAARHANRIADAAAQTDGAGGDADAALRKRSDLLTGLATGDQLQAWVAQALVPPTVDEENPAAPTSVFALLIGVGRFAQINAAYGRAVADRVLSAVAQRLGQIVDARSREQPLGESRLLARLAAAEFAVGIAGPLQIAEAKRLADSLARAFETPFAIDDHVIHLSARVGIAATPVGAGAGHPAAGQPAAGQPAGAGDGAGQPAAAAGLIRRASAALAQARTGDPGSIEVFEADPQGDRLTRMADLESDLHRAIENDDIAILFQPQLSLATGRIIGVEALVRWDHPEKGLLPAETLLGTAASAELAIKLGRHIRARAIGFAARWTGALARLRLSVNVTAADLADPGFAAALEAAIAESGLARHRLTIEVTEGALIADMFGAVQLLSELRQSGVRVALDDFGTGYSSLAWMARLPIDVIKLDRSFTLGLTGSPRERVVVETMVRLSKQLGLNVVAEGVEDDAQMDATRLAGCDAVQGFRVAPPLAVPALQGFCEAWQPDDLGG
jgi:predicted signal transduction protein with EAL and GGDEF domain